MNKLKKIVAPYARLLLLVAIFSSYMLSLAASQGNINVTNVTSALCDVANAVFSVIFILGLMLMIIGAAMYAAAHIMPAQQKGSLQGYGMGMIIGGIVGVVLALLATPILGLIANASGQVTALADCRIGI